MANALGVRTGTPTLTTAYPLPTSGFPQSTGVVTVVIQATPIGIQLLDSGRDEFDILIFFQKRGFPAYIYFSLFFLYIYIHVYKYVCIYIYIYICGCVMYSFCLHGNWGCWGWTWTGKRDCCIECLPLIVFFLLMLDMFVILSHLRVSGADTAQKNPKNNCFEKVCTSFDWTMVVRLSQYLLWGNEVHLCAYLCYYYIRYLNWP